VYKRQIFRRPQHPYTQLLISSIPSLDQKRLFQGIPGTAPSLLNPPSGCAFHPRCPQVMPHCSTMLPELHQVHPGQGVACHLYEA
jgi:oligopeptide/dipeptide ABC transporter ATP-binding protein